MKNWSDKVLKAAVVAAVALGSSALVLGFTSFAANQPKLYWALPLVFLGALLTVIDVGWMFLLVLLTRSMLDPVFNLARGGAEGLGIGAILNALVIGLAALQFLRRPSIVRQHKAIFIAWFVFMLISFYGVVHSPIRPRAFKLYFNFLSYLAMFSAPFFMVHSLHDKRFWIRLLFYASVPPILLAEIGWVLRYQPYLFFTSDTGMRVMGTFIHPNIFAFYLALVVAICLYILKSSLFKLSGIKRTLLILYLANALLLLVMTKTRSAWFSVWALFAIYGFIKERKYLMWTAVGSLALIALPPVWDRIHEVFAGKTIGSGRQLNSYEWRVELWRSSLHMISQNPIIGYGLSSFNLLSGQFFKLARGGAPAHNTYLETIFEQGVVGLTSYLSIFVVIGWRLLKEARNRASTISKESAIVFAYLAGYSLAAYSDNMLYYLSFNWYFYFFLGVIMRSMILSEPADQNRP